MGRWIKIVSGQAGVDTGRFSGHSNRRASTSKGLLSVSTDVILATAGWTKGSNFRKFYNKPVAVTDTCKLMASDKPISYSTMSEAFTRDLKSVGADPPKFGLHSLCSGGATMAANSAPATRSLEVGASQRHVH